MRALFVRPAAAMTHVETVSASQPRSLTICRISRAFSAGESPAKTARPFGSRGVERPLISRRAAWTAAPRMVEDRTPPRGQPRPGRGRARIAGGKPENHHMLRSLASRDHNILCLGLDSPGNRGVSLAGRKIA